MTRLLVLALGFGACVAEPGAPEGDRCPLGRSSQAIGPAERALVGEAAAYPADATLRGRDDELARSQRARREVAWQVVARALAPVALAAPVGLAGATLPRFQTWYGKDDLARLFHHLYDGLGPDGRRARARFGDAAIDAALAWNPHAVDALPDWPADRRAAYAAALDRAARVAGLGGIGRVGYAPGAARHLLASYGEILGCQAHGVPPAFVDGARPGRRTLEHDALVLGACERRELGPYFVAAGETLEARAAGARLEIRDAAGEVVCDGAADAACEAAGPGPLTVTVTAIDGGELAVDVGYRAAAPPWAACLDGGFPGDAVVVKEDWRRADFGMALPVYDTSAARMAERLGPGGDAAWGDGDRTADPGPAAIATLELPAGSTFRLAALHLMSKELDHWMWITLWWSDTPDDDFGADRPAAIAALGGPWSHYKMCVTTSFAERDPDPTGGFGDSSLGRALAAVGQGGGPSWCSNPYLERGSSNAATNCMGCHQHGGTGIAPEAILGDPARFPASGRRQVRDNFPMDYSWTVDRGDRLGALIGAEVDYYDAFEH